MDNAGGSPGKRSAQTRAMDARRSTVGLDAQHDSAVRRDEPPTPNQLLKSGRHRKASLSRPKKEFVQTILGHQCLDRSKPCLTVDLESMHRAYELAL